MGRNREGTARSGGRAGFVSTPYYRGIEGTKGDWRLGSHVLSEGQGGRNLSVEVRCCDGNKRALTGSLGITVNG